jgi:hypothetical protein
VLHPLPDLVAPGWQQVGGGRGAERTVPTQPGEGLGDAISAVIKAQSALISVFLK